MRRDVECWHFSDMPAALTDVRFSNRPFGVDQIRSGGNPSSTLQWKDVPRGTMDEVRSHVRLNLPSPDGKADPKIVPPRPRIP